MADDSPGAIIDFEFWDPWSIVHVLSSKKEIDRCDRSARAEARRDLECGAIQAL